MSKPTILYFQQNFAFGATEAYLYDLAAQSDSDHYTIKLVYPDIEELKAFEGLRERGVQLYPVDRSIYQRNIVRVLPFWVRFFRTVAPNLIHFNDPCLIGSIAAWIAQIPVRVMTHHTPELKRRYNLFGRTLEWLAFRSCSQFIFTSEASRSTSLQRDHLSEAKTVVIPYGLRAEWFTPIDHDERLDIRHRLGIQDDQIIILHPARLSRQKRHDLLITAARKVTASNPNVVFLLAGEGELHAEIEQQIRDAQLTEKMRLLGYRQDIHELTSAADIVVMASDFEGLCYAIMEASARQVAVVSTKVGGTSYSALDQETGLLVPPGDADALANALLKLINDPAQRDSLGQAGRQRAEQLFTLKRMVTDTETLYRALTNFRGKDACLKRAEYAG